MGNLVKHYCSGQLYTTMHALESNLFPKFTSSFITKLTIRVSQTSNVMGHRNFHKKKSPGNNIRKRKDFISFIFAGYGQWLRPYITAKQSYRPPPEVPAKLLRP